LHRVAAKTCGGWSSVFNNARPHSALRDVAGGHAAGKTRKYS